MLRKLTLLLSIGGSTLSIVATSVDAQNLSTQAESRSYGYGAIVTLEHGVRVIRPVPPVSQVVTGNAYDASAAGYYAPDWGRAAYGGSDGNIYYAPDWGRGFRGHWGFNHGHPHFNQFNGRRGGMLGAHRGIAHGFGRANGFHAGVAR